MPHIYRYRSLLDWRGSTRVGYESYDRTHRVAVPPTGVELVLSSDPAFHGEGRLLNPEQLLLAAASSCQLLSFLAIAARARIEVLTYEDDAEAVMPDDKMPMRITHITLRPRIVVAADTNPGRVRRLLEQAHDQCFIANTLNAEITVEPTVEREAA